MKAKKILTVFIVFILISFASLYFYATQIETHQFKIETVKLAKNSVQPKTIKIVQISDMEVSSSYPIEEVTKHIDEINALQPDIIVFTGDLFANYAKYQPYDDVVEALSKLKAKHAKLAVYGNNDYGGGAIRIYESLLEEAGFSVLKNSDVFLNIQNKKIHIAGADSLLMSYIDYSKLESMCSEKDDYCILLAHESDMLENMQNNPFDLTLSGHTHGGQVSIPLINMIFHNQDSKYTKGLYPINTDQYVYVDSGLGTSRMAIRFGIPPQITYFEITC